MVIKFPFWEYSEISILSKKYKEYPINMRTTSSPPPTHTHTYRSHQRAKPNQLYHNMKAFASQFDSEINTRDFEFVLPNLVNAHSMNKDYPN